MHSIHGKSTQSLTCDSCVPRRYSQILYEVNRQVSDREMVVDERAGEIHDKEKVEFAA